MTQLSKTKAAKKLYDEIKQMDNMSNLLYWERARLLKELTKDNLYKNVFGEDGSGSWNSFCSQANLSVSSTKQKVKVYELFVEKFKFDPKKELLGLDTSGLYYIYLSKKDLTKEEALEASSNGGKAKRQYHQLGKKVKLETPDDIKKVI